MSERLPKGAVLIYSICLEIKAQKGEDSLWPGENFKHTFSRKSKVAVYGLPNGDLLLKSQVGKRLYKKFRY